MTPINLLVVSIKEAWRPLIDNSLVKAGYKAEVQYADNKQEAIRLCRQKRYDLMICGCRLPDGTVPDLVNVLGSSLPCLVMSEGVCPLAHERSLSLHATNFYITSSDESTWIEAMKNTMTEWEGRAHERINQYQKESSDLYSNALIRCKKELATSRFQFGKSPELKLQDLCGYLVDVLDLSRISIYKKRKEYDGTLTLLPVASASSPGIEIFERTPPSEDFTIYPRWDFLFSKRMTVFSPFAVITDEENQWIGSRGIMSLMAVPFLFDDQWQGFILAEDLVDPRKWSAGEINLLESLSGLIQPGHFRTVRTMFPRVQPRFAFRG